MRPRASLITHFFEVIAVSRLVFGVWSGHVLQFAHQSGPGAHRVPAKLPLLRNRFIQVGGHHFAHLASFPPDAAGSVKHRVLNSGSLGRPCAAAKSVEPFPATANQEPYAALELSSQSSTPWKTSLSFFHFLVQSTC